MNNNIANKEAVQLLNGSSDSDSASEIQFALAPQPTVQVRRKVRTKRKPKKDGARSHSLHDPVPCSPFSILKVGGVTFAIGGTIILGWIVILLHSNIQELTDKIEHLSQGYEDDAILLLKKSIRDLGQNQTFLHTNFRNISRVMDGFQQQMSTVTSDVASIKDSLKEAPQMMNIGKELDSLKSSLAAYEATIMELKNSYSEVKPSLQLVDITTSVSNMNSSIQTTLDSVFQDLEHQHETLHALKNKTEKLAADSSVAIQRLDAAQTQLIKLESQQNNLSLTLGYAMDVLKEIEGSRSQILKP